MLSYQLTGESGPDHDKKFEVEVLLNGKPCGNGSGSSKKRAEQAAAAAAIDALFPGEFKNRTAGRVVPAVLFCLKDQNLAHLIALSAVSWLSGVTPAQQSARTKSGTSGSAPFAIIAFVMTQISVQRPMNSTLSSSGRPLR